MIRVDLNLEDAGDLQEAKAQWKFALGLVPGEPNEGLTARRGAIPARLADYDDSSWEVCENIQEERSGGLTFGWYRITVTIPEKVHGVYISGSSAYFETCIDDYGRFGSTGSVIAPTAWLRGIMCPTGWLWQGAYSRGMCTSSPVSPSTDPWEIPEARSS